MGSDASPRAAEIRKDIKNIILMNPGCFWSRLVLSLAPTSQASASACVPAQVRPCPDEEDIEGVKTKMAPCGVETVIVDLKKEMAEGCFEALMAQATYRLLEMMDTKKRVG